MAVSCEAKCAKSILISFNLIFWFSGCSLLVIGIWIFMEPAKVYLYHIVTSENMERETVYYLAYLLLSIGGTILLVGFFGCCGALQESRCMLVTYFIFLLLLLCVELAFAVITLIYRNDLLEGLEDRLSNRLIQHYGHDHINQKLVAFSESVDFAQYRFNCCGIQGDHDYLISKWKNDTSLSNVVRNVPMTCCVLADTTDTTNTNTGSPLNVAVRVFHGTVEEPWQHPIALDEPSCQSQELNRQKKARHKEGCISQIEEWFRKESSVLATVSIGIAALQIFGMIFATCLCRSLGMEI